MRDFNTRPTERSSCSWITPREVLRELGSFDLDPCAAVSQPWPCAAKSYTIRENGLLQPWHGRVWCNPPYGEAARAFMERMAAHAGGGLALVFARTDTRWFHASILRSACAMLFWLGRIRFCREDGSQASAANAASVLVAWQASELPLLRSLDERGIGKLVLL